MFVAFIFAFAVKEPALFEFETITLFPEISPETRLIFPLLFVIITLPCDVTLAFDVIPFTPEFWMYTVSPRILPLAIKPPFVFVDGASSLLIVNALLHSPATSATISYV